MLNVKPGQRWISAAEPELGLGTILRADHRQIDIVFTGCGELKHYTQAASPLLRVRFDAGDLIAVAGQRVRIDAVAGEDDLRVYRCGSAEIIEGAIDPEQPMLPLTLRLLIGQSDAGHLFDLRRAGLCLQTLTQTDFEHYAMALLGRYGFRLNPVSEHVFDIDASDSTWPERFDGKLRCSFETLGEGAEQATSLSRNHPLISGITADFLQSHAGNTGFLVDDSLASRSAVLETLFVNESECTHLAIDALGNPLPGYLPSEQALFRSRGSQTDLKPYKRSLERLYPALLQQAMEQASRIGAGSLQALRLVVGSEFALFGRLPR